MSMINKLQYEILEYLGGWFGFLTCSQIMMLTGKKSAGYIREMLGKLRRRNYVRSFRLEMSYKVRSENMYTITPLGVEVLQSHTDIYTAVKMPVNAAPLLVKDFMHRASTVTTMIKIYQHLTAKGTTICALYFYYDKQGSMKKKNLTAKTALYIDGHGSYIPDCILQTDKQLFLVECFCDRDSKRALSSLAVHAKGISAGVPGKAYDMKVNATVLSVFAHKGIMQAVIKKLQADVRLSPEMAKLFFFAALEDLKQDGCEHTFTNIYNETLEFD